MLFGVSMKLKDKRVDKILAQNNIHNTRVYYSPSSSVLIFIILLASTSIPLLFEFIFSSYSIWTLLLIPYFIGVYLFNSGLNNSFALTDKALFIINPNRPFRNFKSYPLSEIEKITIANDKKHFGMLFLSFGRNYLQIDTIDSSKLFFCVALEMDAFDENWTELTIDDLCMDLKGKGCNVVFNIPD
jgi:hypothetical protein